MPHICPRPCSRLATAAVFISVGVVQIVVGIILLRSKYVYLLAGPDFWTAACNIAVGCLLGLSASIWKQSKKRRSRKDVIRRNLLLALLFSALMINSTTLGMYLLGEGNALLSIRLENGQKYDLSTFASEVLAYAYVTSVCCPIICIVVTIVAISGSFFNHAAASMSFEFKTPVSDLEKERCQSLRWVYTPELVDASKKKFRDLDLSSSSESDEDDSEDISIGRKHSYSADDIQHVLNRMAQGKRDTILSDSAMMVRQIDLLRRSRGEMFNKDGFYTGRVVPHSKKTAQNEKRPTDFSQYGDLAQSKARKSRSDYSYCNEKDLPIQDPAGVNENYARQNQLGNLYKNPYTSEELLNEYQHAASKLAHHYPSMYKKFRETLKNESAMNSQFSTDISDGEVGDIAGVHKKSRKMSEAEQNDIRAELQKRSYKSSVTFKEDGGYKHHDTSEETAKTSPSNDCFSPNESYFGLDSTFDISRDSWAGELIPINIKHSTAAKLSQKLVPVASPVVPDHYLRKCSEDSGVGNVESNSFSKVEDNDFKERKSKLSSFREDSRDRNQENLQEYPKAGTLSVKKFDLNKMAPMGSISEEPKMERNKAEPASEEVLDFRGKGTIRKGWKGHLRNKSMSSIEPGSSRQMSYDGDISSKHLTPRKKRSASTKALHKIWLLGTSESPPDFLDQVVDEDSLIGLSEEELIARQLRTRSIRKEVQKRMKKEVSV